MQLLSLSRNRSTRCVLNSLRVKSLLLLILSRTRSTALLFGNLIHLNRQARSFSSLKLSSSVEYLNWKHNNIFKNSTDPLLAVITEPDAISSSQRTEETLDVLTNALQSECIDLICIRCASDRDDLLQYLIYQLMELKAVLKKAGGGKGNFFVIVNGNIELAIRCGADGVHIKEKDISEISSVKQLLLKYCRSKLIIGTSAHSLESATNAAFLDVDYLFVGTCYLTLSHPEKLDLEGPDFPGVVRSYLLERCVDGMIPKVFAIGGIKAENCMEPIKSGANGVAVIRDIMQASSPLHAALNLKTKMAQT